MVDGFVRAPDPLVEAVRAVSGLPDNAPLASLARWSMAGACGWPDAAAQVAAGVRGTEQETEDDA